MSDYYRLDGKTAVPCTRAEFVKVFVTDRIVARTKIGGAEVSTVFLGLNHAFSPGPPKIFETLVFGGKLDQEMNRYSTWQQAEAGHAAMCERVRGEDISAGSE